MAASIDADVGRIAAAPSAQEAAAGIANEIFAESYGTAAPPTQQRPVPSHLRGEVQRNAAQAARPTQFDQRVRIPALPQPNANIQQQAAAVAGTTPAWAQVSIDPSYEAMHEQFVPLKTRQADRAAARTQARRTPTTNADTAQGLSDEQLAALAEAANAERRRRAAEEWARMSPQQKAQLQAENEHLLNTMEEEPLEQYIDEDAELEQQLREFNYDDGTDYGVQP